MNTPIQNPSSKNATAFYKKWSWLILVFLFSHSGKSEAKSISRFHFEEKSNISTTFASSNNHNELISDSIKLDTNLKLIKTSNGDEIIGRIQMIDPKETTILL